MSRTLTRALVAAGAVLALGAAAGVPAAVAATAKPAATAQPTGQQWLEVPQWGFGWISTSNGDLYMYNSGKTYSTFQTWNGNRLEKGASGDCLTYGGPDGQGGYFYLKGCSTSIVAQQYDYRAESGGLEEIENVYNGDCMRNTGNATETTTGTCVSGGSVNQDYLFINPQG